MIHFQNSQTFCKIKSRALATSSVLVPDHLIRYFSSRSLFFGGTKYYFQYLVEIYGRHISYFGIEGKLNNWKTEYQQVGLDLHQKNFKPNPLVWEEFRHIALSLGFAMCKLFTILLELEYSRWVQAGCPEHFSEKEPLKTEISKSGVNSMQGLSQNIEFCLKNLFKCKNGSILVRHINFSGLKLDRMCIVMHN